MDITNKDLKKRILEISFKYDLSHLSTCLEAVDIIDEIYKTKKPNEPFVLSQGHAGLALYVVLEKYEKRDAEALWQKHGTHPNRNIDDGIYCSTGSLGHGLPIAVGMAISDKTKNVYCLVSDGECAEGSIYEAVNFINKYGVKNINIYANRNRLGAYGKCDIPYYLRASMIVVDTNVDYLPFLQGIEGHYHKMTGEEYNLAVDLLK